MWEKNPRISENKRKRSSILSKVDLYEVCASLFQMTYYCYYFYSNHYFPCAVVVSYLTLGERSLVIIGQEASSRRDTSRNMSGGG